MRSTSIWGTPLLFFEFCMRLGIAKDEAEKILECESFGLVDSTNRSRMLTYSENEIYLEEALANPYVQLTLCRARFHVDQPSRVSYVTSPREAFWSLFEYTNRRRTHVSPSNIARGADVRPGAYVHEYGCSIGDSSVVESGAIVLPGSNIGRNCVIGSGSVVGSDGFEVKDTIFGRIRVTHDAGVKISDNVTIGANCTINKGLLGEDTVIEVDSHLDSGVHVAHSCKIGARNIVAANATFGGSVVTGSDVFIGLNATLVNSIFVADNAFVGAGAIVVRSINSPQKVIASPSKSMAIGDGL